MNICYACLKEQCDQRGLVVWKSDLQYSAHPQTCAFCGGREKVVQGVNLNLLGDPRLTRHLYRIYNATERDPADIGKNLKNFTFALDKRREML
ncbi:MAG: hypothetical protein Q3Y08_01415 [Butyricicoccus sp.]|nr:hypothetical protein [Butyricicoccus sp.]